MPLTPIKHYIGFSQYLKILAGQVYDMLFKIDQGYKSLKTVLCWLSILPVKLLFKYLSVWNSLLPTMPRSAQ